MLEHDKKVLFQSLDNYKISDSDDAAYPYYYGFTNKDGEYYLMRMASVTGAGIATRYHKGNSSTTYVDAWAARAATATTYDYFYNVF